MGKVEETIPAVETLMRALPLSFVLCLTAFAAYAASEKERDCGYQADVVGAIQQARLDRVPERDLAEAIAATNPEWPDRYTNAISVLAGPIYEIKRRDLKTVDLAAQWKTACLAN